MNFPTHLHDLWRGERDHSAKCVLGDSFAPRVYRIGLRLDFTCPNRAGNGAVGGGIYCNYASHTSINYRPHTSITAQLMQNAPAMQRRHHAERFIAYFQRPTPTPARPPTNRKNSIAMCRHAWQGRLYTNPEFRTSLLNVSSEGAVL